MTKLLKFIVRALKFFFRLSLEKILVFLLRAEAYFSGMQIKDRENSYEKFVVKPEEIWNKKRKEGISGFYRIKNEEELLEASVKSHIPYLDEVVIVYNDCSDKTPEIAHRLKRQYPEKVHVYEYKPRVFPALSHEHALLKKESPFSLANYYNYALSKTNYKVAVKIDADHIAVPEKFENACKQIRSGKINTMHYFFGVNLFACDSGFCVNKKQAFTHGYDCGFFPVRKGVYFTQRLKSESLRLPLCMLLTRKSLGVLFYHLKGFKKDKGLSFMNKDSFFKKEKSRIADTLNNPALVAFDKYADERLVNVKRITPEYLKELE